MANFIPVVSIFVAFIIIANVPSYASECSLSNIEILKQFIDKTINATVTTMVAEFTITLEKSIAESINATLNAFSDKIAAVNMTVSVLNATVDEKIAAVNTTVRILNATVDERIITVGTTVGTHDVSISKLLGQRVVKILHIALTGTPRTVRLSLINSSTQVVQDYISSLEIHNVSDSYTSNNLAYRPDYSNHAGGNTAILFINLERVIPCYQHNRIGPACQLFTFEEGSFQFGHPFIQASDIGNHFSIFANNHFIATYGFGVTGCSTFDRACVSDFEVALVCLLPPAREHCGI